MTTAPEVREVARDYLPWMTLAPLIGVAAWIFDGIFIGATLTGLMMRTMLVSVAIYAVALAVLVPVMGNHGLWAALMVLNAARGVTMALAYPAVARKAAGGN
jgi:multidrug resistance protein, MATE family